MNEMMLETWDSESTLCSLEYGHERGNEELLDLILQKVYDEENLTLSKENLMLIPGSTGGIDTIARLFGRSGPILLESPSYVDAIHIFQDHDLQLESIRMDPEGLCLEPLKKILDRHQREGRKSSLLYTIPCFQNPTGITTSENRRREILKLLQPNNVIIVEDDVYRDLHFEDRLPPSYFHLAGGKGVFRIGSFSKTLAPGLRLGWLIGEASLILRCMDCGVFQMGGGANPLSAQWTASLWQTGKLEGHIGNIKKLYRQRRDCALAAMEQYMPREVQWNRPKGGFFLWVSLPEHFDASVIQDAAEQQGVLVANGKDFFIEPHQMNHHLRIAYSFVEEREMVEGIRVLAEVISKQQ
jgi:DNA-binding transcriptional MocR family regulator